MLAPTAKTKRLIELTQLVLSFASVCAIVDSSCLPWSATNQPRYYAGSPQQHDAPGDRRLGDLARADRRRREAEQQSNLRRLAIGAAAVARAAANRAPVSAAPVWQPPIPAFAQIVAVSRRTAAVGSVAEHERSMSCDALPVACVLQLPARTA